MKATMMVYLKKSCHATHVSSSSIAMLRGAGCHEEVTDLEWVMEEPHLPGYIKIIAGTQCTSSRLVAHRDGAAPSEGGPDKLAAPTARPAVGSSIEEAPHGSRAKFGVLHPD
jgi:hypothetical protein